MPPPIAPVPITSGIGTSIGAVKDGSNNYYQGTSQYAQITQVLTLQSNQTANNTGAAVTTDGLNGLLGLLISNGAGTCTVTIQGSEDNTFAVTQDTAVVGVVPTWDSTNGVATARPIEAGIISVVANTSYRFQLTELYPYMRAVISSAIGLGAGSSVTGCTIKIYGVPG